ncbi:hypothetical protein HY448_02195 [Candidatus Pacearchaeota archaeon]|nr:hypothetical protein [Candidatus Pacearchaeota archaeon]
MNKIGADKVISVYWFIILFLVAGAVVYIVSEFYGKPYDVREVEANIMVNQVADCLSENGKLIELNEEFRNDFMKNCRLNFKTEFEGEGEYYLEINFTDFPDGKNKVFSDIITGNLNLKEGLLITKDSGSFRYSLKSFYSLAKDGDSEKEIVVKILSIVRKTEKNAK